MKELDKIEENYKKQIRKFPTYNIIEYFSKKSLESFQSDRKGVTSISLPYCTKNGARGRIENFIYGQ